MHREIYYLNISHSKEKLTLIKYIKVEITKQERAGNKGN